MSDILNKQLKKVKKKILEKARNCGYVKHKLFDLNHLIFFLNIRKFKLFLISKIILWFVVELLVYNVDFFFQKKEAAI